MVHVNRVLSGLSGDLPAHSQDGTAQDRVFLCHKRPA